MDSIPFEIFEHFTSYLTFSEKLQAMLVCHEWRVKVSASLYSELVLDGNENFKTFEGILMENKDYAKQLKSLRLLNPAVRPSHILTIPKHFPELQELEWIQTGMDIDTYIPNEEDGECWKNITSFLELNAVCLSVEILEKSGFTNLTKLNINFCSVYSHCQLLIAQLPKAPGLENLVIESTEMSLFDLENLHLNAPKLKALRLSLVSPKHLEAEEAMPVIKTVADGLTSWEMVNMQVPEDTELWGAWMGFIASTYKDLKNLTIQAERVSSLVESHQAKLLEIAAGCPLLEFYSVNLFPITPPLLELMDATGIRLKKVELHDLVEYQVSNLMFSRQTESLEALVLNIDSGSSFEYLEPASNIKHLEITAKQRDASLLALDDLLENSSHLETIKVSNWIIQLGPQGSSFQRGLKRLDLENVILSNANGNVMSFVAAACPDLLKLTIQDASADDDENLILEFPHHHFACIELDTEEFDCYKVVKQGQPTIYEIQGDYLCETSISGDQPYVLVAVEGCSSLKIGKRYIFN
ncbi:hypothetical protein [Parasitella parasitica]|uniref:F-box domain-containing protein n=1 Tax=Parasitella parasitica TaxID=35722 RepID=A0A0B7ND94_9FUNG|nr:hypothetical protein [Parasitella parasitica]